MPFLLPNQQYQSTDGMLLVLGLPTHPIHTLDWRCGPPQTNICLPKTVMLTNLVTILERYGCWLVVQSLTHSSPLTWTECPKSTSLVYHPKSINPQNLVQINPQLFSYPAHRQINQQTNSVAYSPPSFRKIRNQVNL